MLLVPACSVTLAVQLVVPVAVPLPPRLLAQVIDLTSTLSLAVPASETFEVSVSYGVADGDIRVNCGAVASPPTTAPTVHVNGADVVNTPSETLTVTANVPTVVIVPV